jgi:hypothetical protein
VRQSRLQVLRQAVVYRPKNGYTLGKAAGASLTYIRSLVEHEIGSWLRRHEHAQAVTKPLRGNCDAKLMCRAMSLAYATLVAPKAKGKVVISYGYQVPQPDQAGSTILLQFMMCVFILMATLAGIAAFFAGCRRTTTTRSIATQTHNDDQQLFLSYSACCAHPRRNCADRVVDEGYCKRCE